MARSWGCGENSGFKQPKIWKIWKIWYIYIHM
jgi:hypothetical protein